MSDDLQGGRWKSGGCLFYEICLKSIAILRRDVV